MRNRKNLLHTLAKTVAFENVAVPQHPLVEILGKGRVLIENHQGVTQYNDQSICIRVNYGVISVSGCNLRLVFMSKERLIIRGCIEDIRLCKGMN